MYLAHFDFAPSISCSTFKNRSVTQITYYEYKILNDYQRTGMIDVGHNTLNCSF